MASLSFRHPPCVWLHDRRNRVAGFGNPAARFDAPQQDPTDDEEGDERQQSRPVRAGRLVDETERERPKPAGAAFAGLVEAEVFRLTPARDELRVERSRQRLDPTLS